MTNRQKNFLSILVLPLALLLSGCSVTSLFGGETSESLPVGVYKSTDRGEIWVTANEILTTGARATLNSTNVSWLSFDPTDRQTLYLGSVGNGLFYTYDSAARWWQSGPIRSGRINSVAVTNDSALRCVIYVATANRILKTTDCGRFWDQQYYDTRLKEQVLSLLVDNSDVKNIYAGLSTGDIMKSVDSGKSWETISRLSGNVIILKQHSLNPATFYAVVKNQGLWKSVDGGVVWENMSSGLSEYKNSKNITRLEMDVNRPDTLVAVSPYGLMRTTDGGVTWAPISLLTEPGEAKISAVALDQNNESRLYYTTDSTLYRSSDAGMTWETRPLPVTKASTILLVDPKLSDTLYLGVNRPVESGIGF